MTAQLSGITQQLSINQNEKNYTGQKLGLQKLILPIPTNNLIACTLINSLTNWCNLNI